LWNKGKDRNKGIRRKIGIKEASNEVSKHEGKKIAKK
jgi:hypothetical protein